MENKLIIAAAGGGKTTFIINEALKLKSNLLITTFTEANEKEIKNKIIELNGFIPENITVQTWFSFLIQHGARPYQVGIYDRKINGLLLVEGQSGLKCTSEKGFPIFYKDKEINKHFFSPSGKIYSDKLSKFVCLCDKHNDGNVIGRISNIYENIFIDEIQDLVGYDLDIIKLLFNSSSYITLVGDPRQVTYSTHFEKKYKKYSKGNIKNFILNEYIGKNKNCIIDDVSFNHSYRNNQIICNFSSMLYPEYNIPVSKQTKITSHEGIFLVRNSDVNEYIDTFSPQVLKYKEAGIGEMTFGNSKGLGFDRTLLYPTKKIIDYLVKGDIKIVEKVKAKFYVSLTRSKFSVGIVYDYRDNDEFIDGVSKYK